jgi:hypothetical protein
MPQSPIEQPWILARDALRRAENVMGRNDAITTLIHGLSHGVVSARTETLLVMRYRDVVSTVRDQIIPSALWAKFHFFNDRIFWANNAIAFATELDAALNPSGSISCFNVRLHGGELATLVGDGAEEAPPAPNRGGRPRKDWWDALWVEICRQLFSGELKITRQADIERAMAGWAAVNGHDLSESAARARAKLLYSALSAEVKN